jgi:hypothetical protein
MKTQRGALLNTKTNKSKSKSNQSPSNPTSQKNLIFLENKEVRQLFRFSYKTAKTPKSRNAIT